MEGVFAEAEELPHVSEVASPYADGGAGAISKDGKIAYATVQYDVSSDKLDKEQDQGTDLNRRGGARATASKVAARRPAGRRKLSEEEGDASSSQSGCLPRSSILLLTFGSAVAMGLPIITALFALGVGISLVIRSGPTSSTPPTSRRCWRR